MYVSNLDEYGHLLNADNFDTSHLNNDMYMIFDNRLVCSSIDFSSLFVCVRVLTESAMLVQDWERKYLHENWSKTLEEDFEVEQVEIKVSNTCKVQYCVQLIH